MVLNFSLSAALTSLKLALILLVQVLRHNQSLRCLELRDCGLVPEGMGALIAGLHDNLSLVSLLDHVLVFVA